MKYVSGPTPSWRLGTIIGINLLQGGLVVKDKYCTFDCVYCQLGKFNRQERKSSSRNIFIPTREIIKEFDILPKDIDYDWVALSGLGEPTLASNLAEVVSKIKRRTNRPLALYTNSSLLNDPQVRKDLIQIDLVIAKLDASNEKTFRKINRPKSNMFFEDIVRGIKTFKDEHPEKLALQIMLTVKNKTNAKSIADLAKEINPSIVFIGTPTLPNPENLLSKKELDQAEQFFRPLRTYNMYHPESCKPF